MFVFLKFFDEVFFMWFFFFVFWWLWGYDVIFDLGFEVVGVRFLFVILNFVLLI